MRERCSDVDWLHVIFIPQTLCLHVDAGILFSTLNVGSLVPAFPCPSLKGHHWIKFPAQIGTEMSLSSKRKLPVEHLTTFLLQVLLGRLLEHRLLAPIHLQMPWIPTDFLWSWSPGGRQLFLWWTFAVIHSPFIQQNIFPFRLQSQQQPCAKLRNCKDTLLPDHLLRHQVLHQLLRLWNWYIQNLTHPEEETGALRAYPATSLALPCHSSILSTDH